jgi:1-acyl-sn-glycerol-3-phosphate acyltransferase
MLGAGLLTQVVRARRSHLPPVFSIGEHINEFYAKFWHRMRRIGLSRVPRTGPVLIVSNHASVADPFLLTAAAPYRPMGFIIAEEYYNVPVARWLIRLIECVPVKRDGKDTAGTRAALRHLKDGKALGVFMEGRIMQPGEEAELHGGAALLALRTDAVVVPAHISGVTYTESVARGLLTRNRARVRFGKPIDLEDLRATRGGREAIQEATQRLYAAVQELAEQDSLENPADQQ